MSRFPGAGTLVEGAGPRIVVRTRLARSLHEELTPVGLVGLRVLNATLLRVQWIGDLFRRIVVRRLMNRTEWLGVEIEREVAVEPAGVRVLDRLVAADRPADAQLFRCRRVTGTHMASARYFQDQEIELGANWREPMAWPPGEQLAETLVPTPVTAGVET